MNLEWVFKNCILTFIAFTCKPEIQFIPWWVLEVQSQQMHVWPVSLHSGWEERKRWPTLKNTHTPPSTNSLCRLKQVSPKVAVFKNISGVETQLIQPIYFSPMLGQSLAGTQGSLALLKKGAVLQMRILESLKINVTGRGRQCHGYSSCLQLLRLSHAAKGGLWGEDRNPDLHTSTAQFYHVPVKLVM